MSTKIVARVPALIVALALAFGTAQAALAQGKGQLPQIKQPASERFDISGNLTLSGLGSGPDTTTTLSGSGAISGNDAQISLSASSSGGTQQPGIPSSFTFEII